MSYGRLLTAMVTPLNEKFEVDYAEASRLAQHLVAHGSEGIVKPSQEGLYRHFARSQKQRRSR